MYQLKQKCTTQARNRVWCR